MKKLILMLLIFTFCTGLTFDWEQNTSFLRSGPYAWKSTYAIGYWDDTIHVDLDLNVVGPFNDNWLYADTVWDRPGYDIEVDFFASDYDYMVYSDPDQGRSHMTSWDTDANFRMVAHEMGHMFGLYDEYAGGGVNPTTGLIDCTGLMGSLNGQMYDRYYEPFNNWLDGKIAAQPTNPVPEPETRALVLLGMIAIITARRWRYTRP